MPTSQEEAGRLLADCLGELGWVVEVDPTTGGVSPVGGVPVEQSEKYNADVASCFAALGPAPAPSSDQLETLYQAYVAIAECLVAQGYAIPEQPSLESFIESTSSNWDPYSAIPVGPQQQAAIGLCPQPDPFSG